MGPQNPLSAHLRYNMVIISVTLEWTFTIDHAQVWLDPAAIRVLRRW